MRYISLLAILCLTCIQAPGVFARELSTDEQDFFSLKRYRSTYAYFSKYQDADLSDAGAPARAVQRMGTSLVRGFDALNNNRPDAALVEFKRAARTVPEYFHTDFIIALTYDTMGDKQNAAGYYKSYLKKLGKYWDGLYRLTSPVINKTVSFNIPSLKEAGALISRRMAASGIDMDMVSSGRHPLIYIAIFIAAVFGVTAGAVILSRPARTAGYAIKAMLLDRKDRWICRSCGKENSRINAACWNCREPKRAPQE
jgi:tetratricopeptide (TPR) repeat protein